VVSLLAGRRKKIGIRMALGAQRGSGLRMVLVNGLSLATVGVVIGMVAALATAPLRSSLLNGVSPRDPLTFVTRRPDSSDRHVLRPVGFQPSGPLASIPIRPYGASKHRRPCRARAPRFHTTGTAKPGRSGRDSLRPTRPELTQARRSGLSLLRIPVFMARTFHCVDGRQCRSRSSLIL
jgi:hypothetical protein